MNARTLLAMLVAMTLGGTVVAETENHETAEPETTASAPASDSLLEAASHAGSDQVRVDSFLTSPDFRDVRIADGIGSDPSNAAFKIFGAGLFVTAAADFASTEYGLGRPGVYETNPVQGSRGMRVLTHAAAPAFMYFVTQKLHDDGHPNLALAARIGFNIGYSYVVMHNLRTAASTP